MQNFGSPTGMWPCVHLVKNVYHSHPAATCQKAILRFTVHWHAYYGINTNKILKNRLGVSCHGHFWFVHLVWRKLVFWTQLFLVPHGQRNQPIIIPECMFCSKHVLRWRSKNMFEKIDPCLVVWRFYTSIFYHVKASVFTQSYLLSHGQTKQYAIIPVCMLWYRYVPW